MYRDNRCPIIIKTELDEIARVVWYVSYVTKKDGITYLRYRESPDGSLMEIKADLLREAYLWIPRKVEENHECTH